MIDVHNSIWTSSYGGKILLNYFLRKNVVHYLNSIASHQFENLSVEYNQNTFLQFFEFLLC